MIVKGTKINDRYQIIKTLGEGGMANVYLAHDMILDRNVAVKVLRGDLANDEKFIRRFEREALSAASLSHPNIVEMYDVGEDDGQHYIVMEYVDGKTLKQALKQRGHLSVTEVVDIMLQVTDGLACAHDAYIIHRDIKPQNIMLLSNGVIKITDFGVAASLNSTQLTQTNSVMGTVHYLPPEQAQGKGSTRQSDIYSMGIMMYELLVGFVPYKGDNAVEIALKHLKEPLPSVRKTDPKIPQSIENIIIKATAKNPKNRYKDSRSMHEDLKTALDESRANEERYVYKYPENDLDETKKLDDEVKAVKEVTKKSKKTKETKESSMEEVEKMERKSTHKVLIGLVGIFVALILVTTISMLLYFKKSEVKKVKIPDVSNMEIVDAVNTLVESGFEVDEEYKYVADDNIDEGKVVKTSPEIGTLRNTGNTVVLYISSGEGIYTIEDYTGKNVDFAQGQIEAKCNCSVVIEYEEVDEKNTKIKEDTVIRTEPAAGETIKLGKQIKIIAPEIVHKYPDFTTYTLEDAEKFCEKYGVTVSVKYVENDSVEAGTILSQNRSEGSVVTQGASITLTVSMKSQQDDVTEDDTDSTDEDNTEGE